MGCVDTCFIGCKVILIVCISRKPIFFVQLVKYPFWIITYFSKFSFNLFQFVLPKSFSWAGLISSDRTHEDRLSKITCTITDAEVQNKHTTKRKLKKKILAVTSKLRRTVTVIIYSTILYQINKIKEKSYFNTSYKENKKASSLTATDEIDV